MGRKPKVIQQDPEGDAKKAAEAAVVETNQKKAQRRTSSALGSGMPQQDGKKTKLGGGE